MSFHPIVLSLAITSAVSTVLRDVAVKLCHVDKPYMFSTKSDAGTLRGVADDAEDRGQRVDRALKLREDTCENRAHSYLFAVSLMSTLPSIRAGLCMISRVSIRWAQARLLNIPCHVLRLPSPHKHKSTQAIGAENPTGWCMWFFFYKKNFFSPIVYVEVSEALSQGGGDGVNRTWSGTSDFYSVSDG